MKKILVCSSSINYPQNHLLNSEPLNRLRADGFVVDPNPVGKTLTEEQMLEYVPQYDAIIAGNDPVTRRVIEASPNLKIVARNGLGYDAVDLVAASENNVWVTRTPVNAISATVADATFALMLAWCRNVVVGHEAIHQGKWLRTAGWSMPGKKLGVVGLGSIGKEVVKRAQGFDMDIYGYDPYPDEAFCAEHSVKLVSFEELLGLADIVSAHMPANDQTRKLFNADVFAQMRPESLFVNTSRGGIVDQDALVEALQSGSIAGAALDVYDPEPLAADSPLREMENVVLTPHFAGMSRDGFIMGLEMIEESIRAVFAGEKPREEYVVNKDMLERA